MESNPEEQQYFAFPALPKEPETKPLERATIVFSSQRAHASMEALLKQMKDQLVSFQKERRAKAIAERRKVT